MLTSGSSKVGKPSLPHNDRGVNVVATQEQPLEITIHIQVKASSTIGSPDLSEYSGLAHHEEADIGALVTSGSFSSKQRKKLISILSKQSTVNL